MRSRPSLTLVLLVSCGAEPGPPVVDASGAPSEEARPPPLPPPTPPTPGHLAVNHRGLVCILREDGAVACDRFGQPAELHAVASPVRRLSRSEEWTCTHHADAVRCRRGDEEASFAADALVTAGERTLCSVLGDQLTCLGAGTDRPGERLEHRLGSTTDRVATAVADGVLCSLGDDGRLICMTLADPVSPTLDLATSPLRSVDVGGEHVCGLDDDGQTLCGTVDGRLPLQPIPGAPAAQLLAVGTHHACVLSALGHVACWRHPAPPEGTTTFAAPYIVDLPLHDVVALDADGTFTASLDARRGLHRWRIGANDGALLTVHPEPLPGLDNPAPASTPECAGCRWVTQLGDGLCVKDPDDSGVVTTYATCAMRCCWVPPNWSR